MNVKTLCLGILSFRDASGYEIKKLSLEGPFSYFVDVSFGSIYPALVRLTEEGLVSCREEQQSGKPDRKIYSITEKGRVALIDALRQEPAPDKVKSEFLFQMVCAGMLDAETISRMIDRRIAEHDREIGRLEEAFQECTVATNRFVIGYGLTLHRAARDYLAAERMTAIAGASDAGGKPQAAE